MTKDIEIASTQNGNAGGNNNIYDNNSNDDNKSNSIANISIRKRQLDDALVENPVYGKNTLKFSDVELEDQSKSKIITSILNLYLLFTTQFLFSLIKHRKDLKASR